MNFDSATDISKVGSSPFVVLVVFVVEIPHIYSHQSLKVAYVLASSILEGQQISALEADRPSGFERYPPPLPMTEKFSPKRILVIGSSGSGKSTVSSLLGESLGLEVIFLDRHYYRPGWKSISTDCWREEVARLVSSDQWIMDGDFSNTFDIRFPRAEAVIDLAYSRYRCLFQAVKRLAFAVPQGRSDLPVGCRESLDTSLLKWIWRYPIANRPRIDEAMRKWGSHIVYLKFTSPRQLDRWIKETIGDNKYVDFRR